MATDISTAFRIDSKRYLNSLDNIKMLRCPLANYSNMIGGRRVGVGQVVRQGLQNTGLQNASAKYGVEVVSGFAGEAMQPR